jgi:hypothetical protein
MTLPKNNLVMKMVLLISIFSISTTAECATCHPSSPQCCWVIRSWELMGRFTSVSSTSATACCNKLVFPTGTSTDQPSGIPGVTCTSSGNVTQINWIDKSLNGSIPPELGNLDNLVEL